MVGKHTTPVAYNPVVQSPLKDYQMQQGIYPVLDDGLPHYYSSLKGEDREQMYRSLDEKL